MDSQQKKGRPTPKRREAERKNFRPLVAADKKLTKEERKELKAKQRAQRDALYEKRRRALDGTGDPRYLPAQDQGPARKFVRDYIDSRWTLSEFLMPVLILALLVSLLLPASLATTYIPYIPLLAMYGWILISLGEIFIHNRRIRRQLNERFPSREAQQRTGFYVASRMISVRPWRSPRPQVKRGQYPDK